MNPVVHFEMPYKNQERMIDFYSTIFGWKMHPQGQEMGNYIIAHTTETDKDDMVQTPGAINGGFFPLEEVKQAFPSLVISVQDIYKMVDTIEKGGGTVLGKPAEIPNVGMYVMFYDSEGNKAGIIQPFNP